MITLLAGEALEVIDVISSPHNHFEGRNGLVTGGTIPGHTKETQIVAFAQDQIPLSIQSGSNLTQATVTTFTLEKIIKLIAFLHL